MNTVLAWERYTKNTSGRGKESIPFCEYGGIRDEKQPAHPNQRRAARQTTAEIYQTGAGLYAEGNAAVRAGNPRSRIERRRDTAIHQTECRLPRAGAYHIPLCHPEIVEQEKTRSGTARQNPPNRET